MTAPDHSVAFANLIHDLAMVVKNLARHAGAGPAIRETLEQLATDAYVLVRPVKAEPGGDPGYDDRPNGCDPEHLWCHTIPLLRAANPDIDPDTWSQP